MAQDVTLSRRAGQSASTMNFVVWIPNGDRRTWILERAAMLAEKHPSFTLILDRSRQPDAEQRPAPERSATGEAGSTEQGERVDAGVAGASAEEIEAILTSLCADTVPTVLWWNCEHLSGDPVFERLLPHVRALVVDSSGTTVDGSATANLAAFHAAHPEIPVHDLAWMRLSPWHDLIAHFFDDAAVMPELFAIRALRVTSGSDAEALYLAGWLASRLGWSVQARNAFTDRAGAAIAFAHERDGTPRRVFSICIDSDGSYYHGDVTGDDGEVVRVWIEGEHARPERFFPLRAIDNASLLERAVLEPATDDVFETALRDVAKLVG